MNIALVHGIFDDDRKMRPLAKTLRRDGHTCITPYVRPASGRKGIVPLAGQLRTEIDEAFPDGGPVGLIGFSMGGIIARYYIQRLGGDQRVTIFLSISSPHHGTVFGNIAPLKAGREMRRGSPFLADLNGEPSAFEGMAVHSFRTPFDLIIVPASSSIWPIAKNRSFNVIAHPLMCYSMVVREAAREVFGAER